MVIPKSDLLEVTMAVLHVAGQGSAVSIHELIGLTVVKSECHKSIKAKLAMTRQDTLDMYSFPKLCAVCSAAWLSDALKVVQHICQAIHIVHEFQKNKNKETNSLKLYKAVLKHLPDNAV